MSSTARWQKLVKAPYVFHLNCVLAVIVTSCISAAATQRVLPGMPCAGDNDELKWHMLPDGTLRCCQEIICHKGTYAAACEDGFPDSTHCRECPEDTFQNVRTISSHMDKCRQRNLCLFGMVIIHNGSITENRQCACDKEEGYYHLETPIKGECGGPKACPAGQELALDGTCHKCAPGFYKARRSTGSCKNWKDCEDGYKMVPGNRTHNSYCVLVGLHDKVVNPTTTSGPIKAMTHTEQVMATVKLSILSDLVETNVYAWLGAIFGMCALVVIVKVIVVCKNRRSAVPSGTELRSNKSSPVKELAQPLSGSGEHECAKLMKQADEDDSQSCQIRNGIQALPPRAAETDEHTHALQPPPQELSGVSLEGSEQIV